MNPIALACGLSLGLLALASAQIERGPARVPQGRLIVVGGGGTTDAIVARAIELAGGATARILILAQASSDPDSGKKSAEFWRTKGVSEVEVIDLADEAHALAAVAAADFIWMPGGDQNVLVAALAQTKLPEAMRARFEQGALIGGTSAGAAALSSLMIIGGDSADLTSVRSGGTKTAEGLCLWPEVLVDQHFVKRQRFNRLLACVLDHPELVGVGIDERTAVIVTGERCEVLGEGGVIVVDARSAQRARTKDGETHSASGVRLAIYRAGDAFDLTLAEPR
jgi:cyanophycinase